MTAFRRLFVTFLAATSAAAMLFAGVPAAAQSADAPVDVTAAPPPSADSVGPAQLRNFSLGGPASRPSQANDRPASANTAPPATSDAAPSTAATADRAARNAAPPNYAPARSTRAAQAMPTAESGNAQVQSSDPTVNELTAPLGHAEVAPATAPTPTPSLADRLGAQASGSGMSLWPWLAVLIAAIVAAALLWWMRRHRLTRYNDPGRLAFAGPQPDADVVPTPRAPVAQPAPAPPPAPPVAPKPKADDGMIVSRSLRPSLKLEFQPDRLLINAQEIAFQFDLVISNDGAAPARDVLVEAGLFTAHAGQDEQIARFFMEPRDQGDRIAAILPLERVALKSIVRLPIDQVQRFQVEGRDLFVPLVAFNLLFRSAGGEGHASASFMVGRGGSDDAKLAPFLVEPGPKIVSDLSARPHSNGLTPQ